MMQSVMFVLVVIATLFQVSTASAVSSAKSTAFRVFREVQDVYTTNALCSKKHCINPVFPGMEDLQRLEQAPWIASSLSKTMPSMHFCRDAVDYDPALPASSDADIKRAVQRQENAAATTYYYHVYALGLDAWDYQKPQFASDCIKSIWRMACFTHFPRAEVGIMDGAYSKYIRPCQSSCQNYLSTCGVECCDESVQCVFSHSKVVSPTLNVTSQGYLPHDGPSSLCTGSARRSARGLSVGIWALMILVVAMSLQGCAYDVPIHKVGNWRAEPDYLIDHQFIPPGASAKDAGVNSCSIQRLSQSLQCSGRGQCVLWNAGSQDNSLSFCECDKYWADPECRTRRKSQTLAYLLSMFFGIFGADQFYLGFVGLGVAKLFTLGGCGVWWVWDIINIGSAPVYSHNFRVAADLPHFAFVLSCVMFAVFLGFAAAYILTVTFRARKRKEAMLLSEQEEDRKGQINLFADAYKLKATMNQHGKPGGNQQQYLQSNPILCPGGPAGTTVTSRSYGAMPMGYPPMGPSGARPSMGPTGPMGGPMGSMRQGGLGP